MEQTVEELIMRQWDTLLEGYYDVIKKNAMSVVHKTNWIYCTIEEMTTELAFIAGTHSIFCIFASMIALYTYVLSFWLLCHIHIMAIASKSNK